MSGGRDWDVLFDEENARMREEDTQRQRAASLRPEADPARLVARAMLLFHGGGYWDPSRLDEWNAITRRVLGREAEATTRTLCDLARAVLQGDR